MPFISKNTTLFSNIGIWTLQVIYFSVSTSRSRKNRYKMSKNNVFFIGEINIIAIDNSEHV